MIPKQIHYCWFGRQKMPRVVCDCIQTWHKHMPDYKFVLWNEQTCAQLPDNIENPLKHPFVQSAYKAKKYAFVADYVRFWALYHFGGIYLDTDMFVVKSFDGLLDNKFFAAWENPSAQIVSCGCIGAEKGCDICNGIIDLYADKIFDYTTLEDLIVPKLITPILSRYKDIKIYPSDYFYPFTYEQKQLGEKDFLSSVTSNTYAIHLWNLSWSTWCKKLWSSFCYRSIAFKNKNSFVKWALVSLLALLISVLGLLVTHQMTLPFLYNTKGGQAWTIGYAIASDPNEIDASQIQWLPRNQFLSHPPASMMADPFITRYQDKYYIFYEEMSGKRNSTHGNICVLESDDMNQWNRLGYAVQSHYHLSWPNIFWYNNSCFMIPESQEADQLRIYKATNFPMEWELVAKPFENIRVADPMVYITDDTVYLFLCVENDSKLLLYYTDDIMSKKWIEHPASPITNGSSYFRPAGNINFINEQPFFYIQAFDDGYGTGVYTCVIDSISTSCLSFHQIEEPILWKNGETYARDGMHTFNFIRLNNGEYLCVVDGLRNEPRTSWKWDWKNLPEFHWIWKD